jgi:hypothetical protein
MQPVPAEGSVRTAFANRGIEETCVGGAVWSSHCIALGLQLGMRPIGADAVGGAGSELSTQHTVPVLVIRARARAGSLQQSSPACAGQSMASHRSSSAIRGGRGGSFALLSAPWAHRPTGELLGRAAGCWEWLQLDLGSEVLKLELKHLKPKLLKLEARS